MKHPKSDQRPLITFDSVRHDFPDVAGHFIREIRQTHRTSQDFPVRRVKEKLGELRIQIFNAPEPLYDYLEMARLLSLVTCESCGAVATSLNGELRMRPCPVHEAKHRPGLQEMQNHPHPPPLALLDFLEKGPTGWGGLSWEFWWAIRGINDDQGPSTPELLLHDSGDHLLCATTNNNPAAWRSSGFMTEYSRLIDRKTGKVST